MASPVDRLRNPAHTGANRCLPCTAVNVGLAAVAALAVATVSVPLGLFGFALAIVAIALRGYVVPGTPRLTARYLPDRVLARFHGEDGASPAATGTGGGEIELGDAVAPGLSTRVDAGTFLVDSGVVTSPARGRRSLLRDRASSVGDRTVSPEAARELTDEFLTRVATERDRLPREGTPSEPGDDIGSRHRPLLADLFESAPADVVPAERPYPAVRVDHRIRGWPSPAALRADLASHAVLAAQTERWSALSVDQRVELLETIRSLRERCPDCGGPIVIDETPVESCCVASTVATHRCAACGARLLEFDPDRSDVGRDRRDGLA